MRAKQLAIDFISRLLVDLLARTNLLRREKPNDSHVAFRLE